MSYALFFKMRKEDPYKAERRKFENVCDIRD